MSDHKKTAPDAPLTGLCGLAARDATAWSVPRPANEPRWIDDAGRPWTATEQGETA